MRGVGCGVSVWAAWLNPWVQMPRLFRLEFTSVWSHLCYNSLSPSAEDADPPSFPVICDVPLPVLQSIQPFPPQHVSWFAGLKLFPVSPETSETSHYPWRAVQQKGCLGRSPARSSLAYSDGLHTVKSRAVKWCCAAAQCLPEPWFGNHWYRKVCQVNQQDRELLSRGHLPETWGINAEELQPERSVTFRGCKWRLLLRSHGTCEIWGRGFEKLQFFHQVVVSGFAYEDRQILLSALMKLSSALEG